MDIANHRVVGKGGYAQTGTRTQAILKYTFAFIQQLIFIPTATHNAIFASNPDVNLAYSSFNPFISASKVDR